MVKKSVDNALRFVAEGAESPRRLLPAMFLILLFFVFYGFDSLWAGELFRWVDESGVVHVSDTFPASLRNAGKQEVRRLNISTQGAAPSAEHRIPFSITPSGGILVKGVFDDFVDVTLLVDTGASHMVISEKLARRLNYSSPVSRRLKLQTAGGLVEARTEAIAKVALGDACKENVPAVVTERDTLPDGFDAILGLSFLQDFKTTVDYQGGVIILKPHD